MKTLRLPAIFLCLLVAFLVYRYFEYLEKWDLQEKTNHARNTLITLLTQKNEQDEWTLSAPRVWWKGEDKEEIQLFLTNNFTGEVQIFAETVHEAERQRQKQRDAELVAMCAEAGQWEIIQTDYSEVANRTNYTVDLVMSNHITGQLRIYTAKINDGKPVFVQPISNE